MAKASTNLKRGSKVVALCDLPGVPRGTSGRVVMSSGLAWIRYWVDFDNGWHGAVVDRAKLATPEEWEQKKHLSPEEAMGKAAEADTAAAAEGGDAAAVGEGGIPAHLLERSRRARERLAAQAS